MKTDRHAAAFDREAWSRRANEIRARIPVSRVVGRVVAMKKGGNAQEHIGLCPFHNESTPSFTVNDRKGFFHCFGCSAHGDAIEFVRQRQGLDFKAAVELLESENGLAHLQRAEPAPPRPKVEQREDRSKAARIHRIWTQARPIESGSPVDRYLRGRGLLPPGDWLAGAGRDNAGWPGSLRFEPKCWHGYENAALPAMIAAMRAADGTLKAVHRTYLKVTGVGVTKAGTAHGDKLVLGDPLGTWILLGPIADAMVGTEGIETGFAAMMLFKRSGLAFGSRAVMASADVPFECSDFLYGADRNKAHPDPKRSRVGEAAARAGMARNKVGRTVQIKIPNLPGDGLGDFNDMLQLMQRATLKESA